MKILSVSQIKTAEQDAVLGGIFSFNRLMENAAQSAFQYINNNFDIVNREIFVVCGKGNNGGDGLVLASLLEAHGAFVKLCFPFGKPESSPANDFLYLADNMCIADNIPDSCDILIDALFGIGFNREPDFNTTQILNKMNNCKATKISVDVPSGVDGDGKYNSNLFFADYTLTFIALKPCFVLPTTSECCGEVCVLDIGVKTTEYAYLTIEAPKPVKRPKNSHKGTFGTALHITGSYGMCGASILAAKASLVGGVGIQKNFVCDKNYTAFSVSVPEAVTIPCDTLPNGCIDIYESSLEKEILSADSLLIGCGMGQTESAKELVYKALKTTKIPTVIDADGINLIAGDIELLKTIEAPVIITPHPKEMARLCGVSVTEIQNNRPEYAKKLAIKADCIVVLKGANTVVASPDGKVYFNMTGNSGMATGGSGDVLSGLISARLAMGETPLGAALSCVYLHGLAGDMSAKRYSLNGMLPTDIIKELKTM